MVLDDNFLLMDSVDSLFKVSTAKAFAVGKIVHYCSGDFAILNDTLYMTSGFNLIKIVLDSLKTSILLVIDVGIININFLFIYSLFTAYPSCNSTAKELFYYLLNCIGKTAENVPKMFRTVV